MIYYLAYKNLIDVRVSLSFQLQVCLSMYDLLVDTKR